MNKLLTPALLLWAGLASGAEQAPPRPPAVAGSFYPGDPRALSALADAQWAAARAQAAPGIVALLVPHAGLEYSGRTAAKAYRAAAGGRWDTVLVVGTAHHKPVRGASLFPGAYATPEGPVGYDAELAAALLEASPLIVADPAAHEGEHSVEVQLPFLRRALPRAKLAALVMNAEDLETARAVGAAIARAVRGRRVLLVASSDLSHYPGAAAADGADRTALEALSRLDPELFRATNRLLEAKGLPGLEVAWCGEGAVTAVMEAARALGAGRLRVLERLHSGTVFPERGTQRVVGYAAALFMKAAPARAEAAWSAPERSELLRLARTSLEARLLGGRPPPGPLAPNPRFNLPGAAFVTLRKGEALRGCIGHPEPIESLADSVAHNAVASALEDARFPPVTAAELPSLRIEVSVLSPARAVPGPASLRRGDGVILEQGERRGVFLPSVWGQFKTREAFLAELCAQKAGLPADCAQDPRTRLKAFSSVSFEEPGP